MKYQVYFEGMPILALNPQPTLELAIAQLEDRAKRLGYPVSKYAIGKHTVVMLTRTTKTITTYEENAQ